MPGYSDCGSMIMEQEPSVGTRIESYMEFHKMILIPGIEIEIICWIQIGNWNEFVVSEWKSYGGIEF